MADIPVYESTAETVAVVTSNGQAIFDFDFLILFPEQMTVLHGRGDVEAALTYPADFSVSGLNEPNGGTVTLNVATLANDVITMRRVTPIERTSDWQNEGDYKAALVNREQDTVFMIMQELARDTGKTDAELRDIEGKAAVFPGGYGGSKTLPVPSPGKGIIGNASGTGFVPSEFSERVLVDASARAVEAEGRSLAGAGRSEAARDIAEGYRDDANDSQVAAHLSEMNARAAAAATGPVIFYDSKADADAALPELDDNAIIEVFQDESHHNARTRYRVEGGALDLKIYLDILALPSIAALQTLWGLYDGQVARVVDNRQFGHFKWRAGNLTTEVASDPYQGLWVAPTVASDGSLGAWQRMVEKDVYDAEWWLPDTMPTNAEVRLNAAIAGLPNAGRFLLPRREVLVSGHINFSKGLTYEGAGRSAPINGQGGSHFVVVVSASHSRLRNISAGNVSGQLAYGEPGGFHVYDGGPYWNSDTLVEDVSGVDCHAFDVETGWRNGISVVNETNPGGSPTTGDEVKVTASRDIYLENFHTNGSERIGIENMRANGVEIVGGKINMKLPPSFVGFDRGVRNAGAHNIHINGLHVIAPDGSSVYGVTAEGASQGGGSFGATTNLTVEGCTLENLSIGCYVGNGFTRNLLFKGNRIIGRQESAQLTGFAIGGDASANGYPPEQSPARNVRVIANEAVNINQFASIGGFLYDLEITDNIYISNAGPGTRFLFNGGSTLRVIGGRVRGNKGYTPSTVSGGTIRFTALDAASDIYFDDNDFTPDSGGSVFGVSGAGTAGTIKMRNKDSNRTIPTGVWDLVRPPLDQEDYPQGDKPFLDPEE